MRVALAVVLLVSLGSSAAEHLWEALPGKSDDGEVIYVDRSSVKHEVQKDSHAASSWFKARKPKSKYDSWRALWMFDCLSRSIGILSRIKYSSRGNIVAHYNASGPPDLTPVVPESVGEAMLDSVCVDVAVPPAPSRNPDKYP